jgi:molybdopterin-synthase adenylyltransferase
MPERVVALTETLDGELRAHLLRDDRQEDLCFALYRSTDGPERRTVVLFDVVIPEEGDRDVHGNAAFHSHYIRRALKLARRTHAGLALLHSHPLGEGWQWMSSDDVRAEAGHAAVVAAETGEPLLGMTLALDGTWSAREWVNARGQAAERIDFEKVRVVGHRLRMSQNPRAAAPSNDQQVRTVSFWGERAQQQFTDLRIAVVGLGSVGALVAEGLARMGVRRLTLIDHDRVEWHNLDRILGASRPDVGKLKVDIGKRQTSGAASADDFAVTTISATVGSDEGFAALIDCDVAFSCVDRPLPRHQLNSAAYSYLLPVVDGGIIVRHTPETGEFQGANWAVHTAGPGRPCLLCRGAYDLESVSLELTGLLDDPSYVAGLPESSPLKRRENIFPLSASVASFEILQLIAMVSGLMKLPDLQQQRYSYYPGVVRIEHMTACKSDCPFPALVASVARR